ncbi:hypothetical protein LEP1GSC068_2361 [Leptospira sp. Fiocruz LV3954]|nr:hypothetical protein LEP1GSC068_2361 [Leptospira sp. Fiocruz LV3954]
MLSGDFVFDISLLQTILFALFAIMTLFQGRLFTMVFEIIAVLFNDVFKKNRPKPHGRFLYDSI